MPKTIYFLPEKVELDQAFEVYSDLERRSGAGNHTVLNNQRYLVRDNRKNDLQKTLITMPRLGVLVIWDLMQIKDFEKFYYGMLDRRLDQIHVRVLSPNLTLIPNDDDFKTLFEALILVHNSKALPGGVKMFGKPPVPDEKVKMMIKDRQKGLSYAKIADLYGVAKATAQKYVAHVKIPKKVDPPTEEKKIEVFNYKKIDTGAPIPSEIHSMYVMFLRTRKEDSTKLAYLHDFKKFIEFVKTEKGFSPKNLSDLSEPIFFDYFDHLESIGYKGSYIRRILSGFRAFFNYSMKKGVAKSNPTVDIPLPQADSDDVLTNPLSKYEIEKIIETAQYEYINAKSDTKKRLAHRNLLLVYVLVSVGMRGGAILKLKVKDFSYERNIPKLKLKGKGKKYYKVSMDQKTGRMLDLFIQKYLGEDDESIIFFNKDMNGKAISHMGLNKNLKVLAHKAGLKNYQDIKAHSFRVTFATMQDGKLTAKELQKRMGHSSIKMTERYKKIELKTIENEWLPTLEEDFLEGLMKDA